MRDVMRKYVDAGREAVTEGRAEDLARELLEWSRRNAERLVGVVRGEVRRQLRLAGVATREEVSELRKRVRALERQVGPARKTSARKSSAKKSSARKSSGRKTGGSKAPGGASASRTPPE